MVFLLVIHVVQVGKAVLVALFLLGECYTHLPILHVEAQVKPFWLAQDLMKFVYCGRGSW